MSYFDILDEEVNEGLAGRNTGIPIGFNRLNRYIGLRKATFFLIGGNTGSGKTSFVDNCFVLNPFDFVKSKENVNNIKLKIKISYRS